MSLAFKIAGGLVIIMLVSLSVTGTFLWTRVEERMKELETLESLELQSALARRQAELQWSVAETVARLAAELGRDAVFLSAAVGSSREQAEVREKAVELLAHSDLDLLWVTDQAGGILSCGHWPARAGAVETGLVTRSLGRPTLASQRVRNEEWLAVQVTERIPVGQRFLLLTGGLRLDQAVRERMGAEAAFALALVDARGQTLAARPWPFAVTELPDSFLQAIAAGDGLVQEVTGGDGDRYLLASLPLLGAGHVQGSLLAARSLGTLRAWQTNLLGALLAAGVVAILLSVGAGMMLARRVVRPLRELTRETSRVAAGDLDLDLPVRSRDEVGQLTSAFNTMTTSIRKSRLELARSERLAAWRDAARRMAHEVKNPLAPIRMSVENLRRARSTAPEQFDALFRDECRVILEEVDTLRRLVDEFSRFARLPVPDKRPTDPAALVRHTAELYRSSVNGVSLEHHLEKDLPKVSLDPELMGQVLKNLVANALEAVPATGGRVVLECRLQDEEIVFCVTDNGPGIAPEMREHLFEPRATTRSRGSGLGLAISRQIVERHGGRIELDTGTDGSIFRVLLPLKEGV